MNTYYLSIGNSDDKLTQKEWASFVDDIDLSLAMGDVKIHGRWFSEPKSEYQNACWCFESIGLWVLDGLIPVLKLFCQRYRQDSISLAEAMPRFIS